MLPSTLRERRARVTVSVTREEKAEQTYVFVNHRMRIAVRHGGGQMGNAKVEIFGVPLATMNAIARLWALSLTPQNTDTLKIEVHDGRDYIPFFEGVVTWSAVDASGMPQVKLTVEANSMFAAMNQVEQTYTNAGPVTMKDALTDVTSRAGYALDYSDDAPNPPLTDQRVTGTPQKQIADLVALCPDLTWFCNLQRVIVRHKDTPLTGEPIRIATDSGLIGYPVYSSSGLQFQTVFDPRLLPGNAVDVVVPEFEFINRTKWVLSVLAHALDVNVPGGHWISSCAANNYGQKQGLEAA